MPFLRKILDFLLFSNIFIALGAVGLSICTMWYWGVDIENQRVLLFNIFCSTLCSYLVHRLYALRSSKKDQKKTYLIQWSNRHHFLLKMMLVLAVLGSGISFFLLKITTQVVLVLLGIITILYSLPFVPVYHFSDKKFAFYRLRDLPFIKIFVIAIIWGFVTVILPSSQKFSTPQLLNTTNILLLIERILFLFTITLPFDIRDFYFDQKDQLDTIPSKIGIKNTKVLGILCSITLMTLGYYNYINGLFTDSTLFVSMLVFYGFVLFLNIMTTPKRSDYFFTGVVDGTMLLQFVIWWIYFGN